jgi:hypothetical protein
MLLGIIGLIAVATALGSLGRVLIRNVVGIHAVSWAGLSGSEQLFVLLSEQVEKSYQGLSSAETSG